MEQRVIISKHLQTEIATAISECEHDKIFVLSLVTTEPHVTRYSSTSVVAW